MGIKFVYFDKEFVNLSWKWLNDEDIRRLTNTPIFTREEQNIWFDKLNDKNDYFIWGVEISGIKIGACGLKNIINSACEYWGYIGEKTYWGHGLGHEMMTLAEEEARVLGMSGIWLKVIKDNNRAISLYKKQGYNFESETDTLFVMRKKL